MARIAVGGFQHETNTFAPQQATWEEFVRADAWPPLLRGPEMIAGVEGFNIPIAGAVKRLAELGHEVVPLAWAAAAPASYVTEDAYEKMWALFDEDLAKLGPFDAIYLDLHGAMVAENTEDGEGELLEAHPHDRRRRHADRGEPRLSRQPHARHGEPRHGPGRLSHLSAHRHGGDRQARRRASGPPAQGEAAGLSRLPPARFPDPAGLAVHLHRAGQEHLRSGGRARGRREEPQPGHRQRHPHAGLSAGRHRPVRTGAGGLRPRQGSGRSGGRQARPDGEGAGEGLRRRAARSRRRGAARHRAFEERQEADRARRRAGQSRRRRHLGHGRAAGRPDAAQGQGRGDRHDRRRGGREGGRRDRRGQHHASRHRRRRGLCRREAGRGRLARGQGRRRQVHRHRSVLRRRQVPDRADGAGDRRGERRVRRARQQAHPGGRPGDVPPCRRRARRRCRSSA